MENVLKVQNLSKHYPHFDLDNISFCVRPGTIMGFIGRNGAGKSTTLKSLLNLVHPDAGEIEFFDKGFTEHEKEIKQEVGFVSGGVNYYGKKKLRVITECTKKFYKTWDQDDYERFLKMFALDESKTPEQLSEGMKVKYSLALALSHRAKLLILDEPTSGLDPISRDELLEVFLNLVEDEKVSILFSTHITSDLDKCADDITYIQNGKMVTSMDMKEFVSQYRLVDIPFSDKDKLDTMPLIGISRSKSGYSSIVKIEDLCKVPYEPKEADLESIMVHMEKTDARRDEE